MRWKNSRDSFFLRQGSTSRFGLTVQILGAVSVLVGIHMIYPPLAYLVAGASLVLAGEKL